MDANHDQDKCNDKGQHFSRFGVAKAASDNRRKFYSHINAYKKSNQGGKFNNESVPDSLKNAISQ